jgi:hypothetical protein
MAKVLAAMFGVMIWLIPVTGYSAAPVRHRSRHAVRAQKPRGESYPKIRAAIVALDAAKAELEGAQGNFGGHKSDALQAVLNAQKQLRLALQFAKY